MGEIDRQMMAGSKTEYSSDVVVMFVRDEDGGEMLYLQSEASETDCGIAQAETAIQQHGGATGLGDQRVSRAAAAEGGETHYFS
jgi:hypothetical protein